MNCLLYARVSTGAQADRQLSLPAQLAAMRQHAIHQEWTVLEEFIEAGVSGRSTDRPELARLLARCAGSQTKVQAVVVHKLDRLARNLADHVAIRALLSKQGVRLVSVTENLDDSVSGQLVEHIMASIAEFYSANLGEEVKKGMRQKVVQGGWPHKPPRGYRLSRDPWGRSRIEVDSKLAPAITKAFELAVSGMHRGADLRITLHRLGLGSEAGEVLPKNAVVTMLRNPFYCGRVVWKGQAYPGIHTPLVSPELFDQVQEQLKKRPYSFQKSKVLLSGLARCANCSALMSAEAHGRHRYYRCRNNFKSRDRCRAPFCNVLKAHLSLRALYEGLAVTSELADGLTKHQQRIDEMERVDRDDRQRDLRVQLNHLELRSQQLADALAQGTMAPDVYAAASIQVEADRATASRRLAEDTAPATVDPRMDIGQNLWRLHSRLSPTQQRALVQIVFGELRLSADGITTHRFRIDGVDLSIAA